MPLSLLRQGGGKQFAAADVDHQPRHRSHQDAHGVGGQPPEEGLAQDISPQHRQGGGGGEEKVGYVPAESGCEDPDLSEKDE